MASALPLPGHFDPSRAGEIYRVDYQNLAPASRRFAAEHEIAPADADARRVGLLLVDVQNTFCIPGFELFVAGRSGRGAVDDNARLASFLYRNLSRITRVHATLDTHHAMAIFHESFLVDGEGNHPAPMTTVTVEDVEAGRIRIAPEVAASVAGGNLDYLERHLLSYCRKLAEIGKLELMVWPYHGMLGGIGHAIVSAIEEATFFHTIARGSQAAFEIKGRNPLTENYSVLSPEVLTGADGDVIASKNERLIDELLGYDALVVAGQAKSHCVAWTVADLLGEIRARDPELATKVYLLEDCASAVVVPGVVDFTDGAEAAYREFAAAGMRVVRSTDPMDQWPGFDERGEPKAREELL